MIDVTFSIAKSEYMEAQKLFIRDSARWTRRLGQLVSGILGVFVLLIVAASAFGHSPISLPTIAPAVVLIIFLTLGTFTGNPLQRLVLSRRFPKEARNLTNMHARIDDDGFWCEIPQLGSGITNWTAYFKYLEGPNLFIFKTAYTFRVLPKRVLSEFEVQEVRTYALQHIPQS